MPSSPKEESAGVTPDISVDCLGNRPRFGASEVSESVETYSVTDHMRSSSAFRVEPENVHHDSKDRFWDSAQAWVMNVATI